METLGGRPDFFLRRRDAADFALFGSAFPPLEMHDGQMVSRSNRSAGALADFAPRTEVGRCDAKARGETGGYGWLGTLGNYARERVFARWWLARYVRIRGCGVSGILEVAV